MTSELWQRIEEVLATGDDQDAADTLVDLLEPLAETPSGLDQLIDRYAAKQHRGLRRVLAFYVARAAFAAEGAQRNAVWRLVPGAVAQHDATTIANLCTAAQRLSLSGVPWDPAQGNPPEALVALFEAALASGGHNVDDAVEALFALAEASALAALSAAERQRLAAALAPVASAEATELRATLQAG